MLNNCQTNLKTRLNKSVLSDTRAYHTNRKIFTFSFCHCHVQFSSSEIEWQMH